MQSSLSFPFSEIIFYGSSGESSYLLDLINGDVASSTNYYKD
jgi:hypothetical protein